MGKVTKALCALAGAGVMAVVSPTNALAQTTADDNELFLRIAFMMVDAQVRYSPEYKANPTRGPELFHKVMENELAAHRANLAELTAHTHEIMQPGKLRVDDCDAEEAKSSSQVGREDFLRAYDNHLRRTGVPTLRSNDEINNDGNIIIGHNRLVQVMCHKLVQ